MRALTGLVALGAIGTTGCLSSLIDDPCADGYHLVAGTCVERPDPEATDDGDGITDDGMTVEPVCTADTQGDPDNCGACGHVCASGLCSAGRCLGDYAGHIVAIGHDYSASNEPMRRVLANAAALGVRADLHIAHYAPAGSSTIESTAALTLGLDSLGRAWHAAPRSARPVLADLDVLIVDPLHGDADEAHAAGAAYQTELDAFLGSGGIVILLEGATSITHRFAAGAGLYAVEPPTVVSGTVAVIVNASDQVAQHVLSPYAAVAASVAFPDAPSPVIEAPSGDALVFHLSR